MIGGADRCINRVKKQTHGGKGNLVGSLDVMLLVGADKAANDRGDKSEDDSRNRQRTAGPQITLISLVLFSIKPAVKRVRKMCEIARVYMGHRHGKLHSCLTG